MGSFADLMLKLLKGSVMELLAKKKGSFYFTPMEELSKDKPASFKVRLLSHSELAEFEDKEKYFDLDKGEVIDNLASSEIEIALRCISGWKNITVNGKALKYKGDVSILDKYDAYYLLREVGQYIKAISKDPSLEAKLNEVRAEYI